MSGPAVVRSLAALERAIGVRLLQRTTRRSSLSDEGREYYERCKRVLAAVDEAETSMSARRSEPHGRLRITAPATYGRMHVAPIVNAFIAKYPAVEVDLLLLDRVVDLIEEGLDAAVRIGELPDSTLVARALGETRRVVCAAPACLRRAGIPKTPAELQAHRCIVFSGLAAERMVVRREAATRGRAPGPAHQPGRCRAGRACIRGLGCGQFLSYQVEAALREGRLKRLLKEYEPPPLPIHIVYPHARPSSNVRAFIDLAQPFQVTR